MKRILFLVSLMVLSFAPLKAQELDLGFSRFDILTADKQWAGIDCKVYCEIGVHMVSSTLLYELGDELIGLIPGVDDTEARLLAIGGSLGFAIGAEIDPFLDTLYDDDPEPGQRRANAFAEALEKTPWAFGELGAMVVGDLIGSELVGRFVGITANLLLQRQLLPHRGLVPLSAPIVMNP